MALSSRIARPLLASMFIVGGADSLRDPAAKAKAVDHMAPSLAERLGLPQDPETLVKINGVVQLGAGLLLAIGRFPRLAALALAASLVPTTLEAHAFWDIDDPDQRKTQMTQFLKNASMLGGLLLAASDTEGRPSITWRGKRAMRHAGERVSAVLPDRG